jgi:hypothetical protein
MNANNQPMSSNLVIPKIFTSTCNNDVETELTTQFIINDNNNESLIRVKFFPSVSIKLSLMGGSGEKTALMPL